jgi:predicted RNA methylase
MLADAEMQDRRKRLGQYFTERRVARLLALLADAPQASSVIDPMAGSGNMLAACASVGCSPTCLRGIEIDPRAADAPRELPGYELAEDAIVRGDAFDVASWAGMPESFDLVITNPPYVRYQLGSAAATHDVELPSATEVRDQLVNAVGRAPLLQDEERDCFAKCAADYSGLADLAVPSWILCCARVAHGGRLAIVVPDTWLSRDYAAPVVYLLRRFFVIEYVVEDGDVSWFPDALARTTLVVARRVRDKGTAHGPGGHLRVTLTKAIATEDSIVGRAFPGAEDPDTAFANWAATCHGARSAGEREGLSWAWSNEADLVRALQHGSRRLGWMRGTEKARTEAVLPERIARIVDADLERLETLEQLGWRVGQGLRSGANDFFYVSAEGDGRYTSPIVPNESLRLPGEVLRPAVRRQEELPDDGSRVVDATTSFVLMLQDRALPEDIAAAEGPRPWQPVEGDLERLIRAAGAREYVRRGQAQRLPELSAVRTNARRGSAIRPARFWYQLPPLSDRHVPAIFVPRVNGAAVTPYLNPNRALIVDANFSSLWPAPDSKVSAGVLMCLLTSSWTRSFLEASATVMGGGALKLEASHLRQLLVPCPDADSTRRLAELASSLLVDARSVQVHDEIDAIIARLLGGANAESILALSRRLVARRSA